jgi:uncharacterized protein YndB with AHSA1/START domain
MRFDDEVLIDAPITDVWSIYSDVERWPDWTASVRTSEYVGGHDLVVGARVRIDQPKLPTAEWEVAAIDPGRSWTWVAKGPGVRTTATHTLVPVDDGSTRVHQTIEQHGPVGAIIGRVYGKLTRDYLRMEAAGLKQRCESHRAA